MKHQTLKSDLIMLLAALIWGVAFIAQRVAAQTIGAFTFTGLRFAMGALVILPFYFLLKRKEAGISADTQPESARKPGQRAYTIRTGIIAGLILFVAVSLQQIGLIETEAGKTAFITGLYIVLVPIAGLFLGHKLHLNAWLGAGLAVIGLYLLSVRGDMSMSGSDLLIMASAFLWTGHIIYIGRHASRIGAIKFSLLQFITCSAASLIVAVIFETWDVAALIDAAVPLLYGGFLSVGIAYTLQVLGQKHARPSHAAIVLSMEAVFGALSGWLILNENLGLRGYIGCALMLAGMLVSQLVKGKNVAEVIAADNQVPVSRG